MKYFTIFCLLMVQNLFGQTIDCASLGKITEKQAKSSTTMRMQTTTIMNLRAEKTTMESTMEMDAAKSMRTITKMPKRGPIPSKNSEIRLIKGVSYTKNVGDSVWYFKIAPPKDSLKMVESMKKIEVGRDCKIVGTETIDGKLLTIVESSIMMAQVSIEPIIIRSWYNLEDSTLKKTETNYDMKGTMQMKMVSDYGVSVAAIDIPLNAVSDSLRPKIARSKPIQGAYANQKKGNMVVIPEQLPEFKDGMKGLFDFLKNNLDYPQAAKDAKLEGTVYLGFVVEIDGSVTDIAVKRGIGLGCDEAAMEVIKKTSGKWNCALEGGKPVRSPFTLPVKFKL